MLAEHFRTEPHACVQTEIICNIYCRNMESISQSAQFEMLTSLSLQAEEYSLAKKFRLSWKFSVWCSGKWHKNVGSSGQTCVTLTKVVLLPPLSTSCTWDLDLAEVKLVNFENLFDDICSVHFLQCPVHVGKSLLIRRHGLPPLRYNACRPLDQSIRVVAYRMAYDSVLIDLQFRPQFLSVALYGDLFPDLQLHVERERALQRKNVECRSELPWWTQYGGGRHTGPDPIWISETLETLRMGWSFEHFTKKETRNISPISLRKLFQKFSQPCRRNICLKVYNPSSLFCYIWRMEMSMEPCNRNIIIILRGTAMRELYFFCCLLRSNQNL